MLREMTSRQLDEWIAFYGMEPWGLAVLDNLIASIKALIININLPRHKTRIRKLDKLLLWPMRKEIEAQLDDDEDF